MKKIIQPFVLAFFAGLLLISACDEDPDPTKDPQAPTLTFNTASGFEYQDASKPTESTVKIGVACNVKDESRLRNFKIEMSTNGGPRGLLKEEQMDKTSFALDYSLKLTGTSTGLVTLYFSVTTDKGLKDEKAITFTVYKPDNKIQIGEIGHREVRTVLNKINGNKVMVSLTGSLHHRIGNTPPYSTLGIGHCSGIDEYRRIYNGSDFKFFVIVESNGNPPVYYDYFKVEKEQNNPGNGIVISGARNGKMSFEIVPLRSGLVVNSDCGTGAFIATIESE